MWEQREVAVEGTDTWEWSMWDGGSSSWHLQTARRRRRKASLWMAPTLPPSCSLCCGRWRRIYFVIFFCLPFLLETNPGERIQGVLGKLHPLPGGNVASMRDSFVSPKKPLGVHVMFLYNYIAPFILSWVHPQLHLSELHQCRLTAVSPTLSKAWDLGRLLFF